MPDEGKQKARFALVGANKKMNCNFFLIIYDSRKKYASQTHTGG